MFDDVLLPEVHQGDQVVFEGGKVEASGLKGLERGDATEMPSAPVAPRTAPTYPWQGQKPHSTGGTFWTLVRRPPPGRHLPRNVDACCWACSTVDVEEGQHQRRNRTMSRVWVVASFSQRWSLKGLSGGASLNSAHVLLYRAVFSG